MSRVTLKSPKDHLGIAGVRFFYRPMLCQSTQCAKELHEYLTWTDRRLKRPCRTALVEGRFSKRFWFDL